MSSYWINEQKNNANPSLLKVVAKSFLPTYMYFAIPMFVCEMTLRLLQPFVIGWLTRYFSNLMFRTELNSTNVDAGVLVDRQVSHTEAMLCAAFMAFSAITFAIARDNFYYNAMRLGELSGVNWSYSSRVRFRNAC